MGEPHYCHATNCTRQVQPRFLMCPKHWKMVPMALKDAVWEHYKKGQEITKDPSHAYLVAAQAAIDAVYARERALFLA